VAVRFGIYLNNRGAVFLGDKYPLSRLLELACFAEELGFDFLTVADSILAKPRYMPVPLLSAIAARTSSIELATGILQPHMRNPVLLAKDWTTLDVLSGGRSILTVGLGTGAADMVQREYELVGLPKARRGRAFAEATEIIRRLWTEELVTLEGEFWQLRDVELGFAPARKPYPPIVVAAGGYVPREAGLGPNDFFSPERADTFHFGPLERVARLGDGWMMGTIRPDEIRQALTIINELARQRYGRTLGSDFRTIINCWIHVGPDPDAARREAVDMLRRYHELPMDDETVDRLLVYGPPERCAERLMQYVDAGVNHLKFTAAAEDPFKQLETIMTTLRPLLT
jgi:alkanesulfonate monooxygenase SsuD/methylene tetrahydromethanopterin reductase-like flavin-dependent oxidoreductase (luciferase family)